MSIWDNEAYKAGANDTKFLNKMVDGDSVTLTFTALNKREQRESTPESMRSDDGLEFVFFFQDEAGNEKEISQKSTKGKFFEAMRDAKVEPGEIVYIERKGAGNETTWKIEVKEKVNPLL